MPRNTSGSYSLPQAPFVAGTTISSAAVNSNFSDIASALTGSLARDGSGGMTGQLKHTDGTAVAPSLTFTSDPKTGFYKPGTNQVALSIAGVQALLFTSSGISGLLQPGIVVDYAGATAPSQWLLCFGQVVSRTTYPLLFAAIGTQYGAGDGTTTFGVPDLRGVSVYGKDDMGGTASGRITTAFYGGVPTTLGSQGGVQSTSLALTHMAPYTPSGSLNINATWTQTGSGIPGWSASVGGPDSGAYAVLGTGAPVGAPPNITITGTVAASGNLVGTTNGGNSTAFSRIAPSSILNKIIFAGGA